MDLDVMSASGRTAGLAGAARRAPWIFRGATFGSGPRRAEAR